MNFGFPKFLKKMAEKPQAREQSQPSFSPDDPSLASYPCYLSQYFVSAARSEPTLNKLATWLDQRPDTQQYLYFRVLPLADHYRFKPLRDLAIKTQIFQLYTLVSKTEGILDQMATNPPKEEGLLLPFKEIEELNEAQLFIIMISVNESLSTEIRIDLSSRTQLLLSQTKSVAAQLMSLLCSMDAIPPNLIPIVQMPALSLTTEEIQSKDSQCTILINKCNCLKKSTQAMIKKLSAINSRFEQSREPGVDPITSYFSILLCQFHSGFDAHYDIIPISDDTTGFIDFLHHPLSKNKAVASFLSSPSKQTFDPMVKEVVAIFSANDLSQSTEIYALCCHSAAPLCIPDLKIDRSGSDIPEEISALLELICIDDPLNFLEFVEKQHGGDIEYAAKVLEKFSSNWKALLNYFCEFSSSDFLPSALSQIHSDLIAFLQKN